MFRSLFLLGLFSGALAAADFSGRWAGTMEMNGTRYPFYLTLSDHDGAVSGLVATGANGRPMPLENIGVRGGELSFQIHDDANRAVQFRLALNNGVLGGDATVGAQVSRIAVVPVNGGGGGAVRSPISGDAGVPVFRVGGGVSAPVLIYKVDPEYTEAARQAKYQGTVLLYVEIAPDGRATNIRVQRSLGLGLDEKAVECVQKWRFRPGSKDGNPVTVAATIEVNFRM